MKKDALTVNMKMMNFEGKTDYEIENMFLIMSDFIAKNIPSEQAKRFIVENFALFYLETTKRKHYIKLLNQKIKWLRHKLVLAEEEEID